MPVSLLHTSGITAVPLPVLLPTAVPGEALGALHLGEGLRKFLASIWLHAAIATILGSKPVDGMPLSPVLLFLAVPLNQNKS